MRIAQSAQTGRYNEFVESVLILDLPVGGGWDPGDFQENSPYIVYTASKQTSEEGWTEYMLPRFKIVSETLAPA